MSFTIISALENLTLFFFVCILLFLAIYVYVTRCKFRTLSECTLDSSNINECGPRILQGPEDCERLAKVEPCYCRRCSGCLTEEDKDFCDLSYEEMVSRCKDSFT